jgi:hypothetical protein
MALPPPRRPGLPYGGAEERTPLPPSVNEQIIVLRHHQDRAFEAIERLANTVNGIVETLHGAPGKFDDAIVGKVLATEKRERFWGKIWIGILTAVCIAMVTWVARISYIVQSSKVP